MRLQICARFAHTHMKNTQLHGHDGACLISAQTKNEMFCIIGPGLGSGESWRGPTAQCTLCQKYAKIKDNFILIWSQDFNSSYSYI